MLTTILSMRFQHSRIPSPHGFTLIDMMVATAIIITISVVMIINFKAGRERDELRNTGLFLVSLLHQAQTYTLAGRVVDIGGAVTYPAGGYAISIDTPANEVVLFANETDDKSFSEGAEIMEEKYILADYNTYLEADSVCVDIGAGCEAGIQTIDYFFVPPLASRSILGFTPNQGSFSFFICHGTLSQKGMRLSSSAVTGQVSLGPIEDTSYCQL